MLKVPTIWLLTSLIACFVIATAYPATAIAQSDQDESADDQDRDSRERDRDETSRSDDSDRNDYSVRDDDSDRSNDSARNRQDRDQRARDQRDERRSRRDRAQQDRWDHSRSVRDDFPAPRDSYNVDRGERGFSDYESDRTAPQRQQGNQAGLGVTLEESDREEGVIVTSVLPGSPAEEMGLEEQDRITHLNGQSVRTAQQFASDIRNMQPGDEIELEVQRNDNERNLSGELESRRAAIVLRDRDTARESSPSWRSDRDSYQDSDRISQRPDDSRRDVMNQSQTGPGQRDLASRINSIQRQIDRLNDELDQLRYAIEGGAGRDRQSRAYRYDQGETTASYQEYGADRGGEYRASTQREDDRPYSRPSSQRWNAERRYRSESGPGVSGENYGDTAPRYRVEGENTQGGEIGGERLRPGRE